MDRLGELEELANKIRSCTLCRLHENRTNAVPGEGSGSSGVMFIGEAPGRSEDKMGRPFVGRAGQLLTELITLAGLRREDVYITNVVKCRPPGNRDPLEDEIRACLPYLRRQIQILRPRLIVTLGRHAAKTIAMEAGRSFRGMTRERGRSYRAVVAGVEVTIFMTYHPAAALYNPGLLEKLREDFMKIPSLLSPGKRGATLDDFL